MTHISPLIMCHKEVLIDQRCFKATTNMFVINNLIRKSLVLHVLCFQNASYIYIYNVIISRWLLNQTFYNNITVEPDLLGGCRGVQARFLPLYHVCSASLPERNCLQERSVGSFPEQLQRLVIKPKGGASLPMLR